MFSSVFCQMPALLASQTPRGVVVFYHRGYFHTLDGCILEVCPMNSPGTPPGLNCLIFCHESNWFSSALPGARPRDLYIRDLRRGSNFWLCGVAEDGEEGRESKVTSLMFSSPEFSERRTCKGARLPENVLMRGLPHFSSVPLRTVLADCWGH